jgi:DNA-binding transcriptional LysR family regulator
VQHGGVSAAAEELHISQPALSAYIRNLEFKTDITFFHKVDGVMHMTPEGKLYLEYAQKIVDLDETLVREIHAIHNLDAGEVFMGITATRGTLYLHHILPAIKAAYPGITVRIKEADSTQHLEDLLYHRKIDFAIMNYPFITHDLDYETLSQEEIVIAVPAENPVCALAGENAEAIFRVDIALLKDGDFILLTKGQRLRKAADMMFAKAGFTPRVLWETRNSITAYNLSVAGMGLSVVTSGFTWFFASSKVRFFAPIKDAMFYEVVIAFPSRSRLSNSARAVIDTIKSMKDLFTQ